MTNPAEAARAAGADARAVEATAEQRGAISLAVGSSAAAAAAVKAASLTAPAVTRALEAHERLAQAMQILRDAEAALSSTSWVPRAQTTVHWDRNIRGVRVDDRARRAEEAHLDVLRRNVDTALEGVVAALATSGAAWEEAAKVLGDLPTPISSRRALRTPEPGWAVMLDNSGISAVWSWIPLSEAPDAVEMAHITPEDRAIRVVFRLHPEARACAQPPSRLRFVSRLDFLFS